MATLDDLVAQLERLRLDADRAYNAALTQLATVLRTDVPTMPISPGDHDPHAASTRELIDLTRRRFEESVRFQHALAIFLMQITGFVDTRDRTLGGSDLRAEILQARARVQELARAIDSARPRAASRQPQPAPAPNRGQVELATLEAQPDGSLASLESSGVLEHLDAAQLVRYLALAFQKLRPGAALTIDAINGASWHAFFGEFIKDTSRTQVLHPDTLRFLVEHAGFTEVAVHVAAANFADRLPRAAAQPEPQMQVIADIINAHADRLNDRLFAAPTFSVTGVR